MKSHSQISKHPTTSCRTKQSTRYASTDTGSPCRCRCSERGMRPENRRGCFPTNHRPGIHFCFSFRMAHLMATEDLTEFFLSEIHTLPNETAAVVPVSHPDKDTRSARRMGVTEQSALAFVSAVAAQLHLYCPPYVEQATTEQCATRLFDALCAITPDSWVYVTAPLIRSA